MTKRTCGDCTLCCRLVPLEELDKPAGQRCEHQCRAGCRIYDHRPMSCALWNCRWLVNDDTAELRRPDRSHYVIDIMPDYVRATNNDRPQDPARTIPVIQIWIDPAYPDAHRDPALRAYIDRQGARDGTAALIRFGNESVVLLVPPSMTREGWVEIADNTSSEPQHSMADKLRVLGEARMPRVI